MPEIKHQFTGGKMNKDLDERLIPNGEYKDALNIQVSTSEGSDVGTVQNILGNSLLAGQGFIDDNSFCVGSIADEKNDKLYYFITSNEELIANGNFDHDSSNWALGSGWAYANEKIEGNSVALYNKINQNLPDNKFITGETYEINFTVSNYVHGKLDVNLINEYGDGFRVDSFFPENRKYTFRNYMGSQVWADSQYWGRFWIERVGASGFTGDIDNISIRSTRSAIIEYDSNTSIITPVLVDIVGDVLKFNPDNIITGINIIDDLLFWTDNKNEPKKINIERSIRGTDPSGTVHTNFINDKRIDVSNEAIREEHITVIKKSPIVAPAIELISERMLSGGKINSGVMRITEAPTPPTELNPTTSALFQPHNLQNQSSLWVAALSRYNHLHDFSTLSIGDTFDTQIETDINGDSGFELNWNFGDTIVFKEFGGDNYDIPPKLPLEEYSVRAKIVDTTIANSLYTSLSSPTPYSFSDQPTEMATNGDFIIPNYNGGRPKSYSWSHQDISYLPTDNYIQFQTTNWQKVYSNPSQPFEVGAYYEGEIVLSNVYAGKVNVYMILEDPQNTGNWFTVASPLFSTNGTHKFTLSTAGLISGSGNTWGDSNGFFFEKFIIQSSGSGLVGRVESISIKRVDASNVVGFNAAIRCEVTGIFGTPIVPAEGTYELKYAVDKFTTKEKLFEFKFPRFAYRYQYEDREYSAISPFSPAAFLPGTFDYHPKKGYNSGMTNRINEINIKDFTKNVPDGVVAIDILYKDDASPSIYLVDNIKPKHSPSGSQTGTNIWEDNVYTVTSEQINQILPTNQLLRSWDAVPKKALAQDISGNRIIYGNYTQGFDLKYEDEDYYPDFDFRILNSNASSFPKKSVKSLREYQLGVVFVDAFGRETPVISNVSGTEKLDKLAGDKSNELQVAFNNVKYPKNMKYFKFFIKEISGEYYNLAMDRYYDAEDGQFWLSFPSSDRNKIDIDTFLILKKGLRSNRMVGDEAKFKILDIKNEAPDFIKQNKTLVEVKKHDFATTNIFENNISDAPLLDRNSFKMNYDQFNNSSGSDLHKIEDDLYIEFTNASNNMSKRYRVAEITTDYIDGVGGSDLATAEYSVKLDKKFGNDINFISDSADGSNPTKIDDGTIVNIYRYTKENSPKFDGRFFVKIEANNVFEESLSLERDISVYDLSVEALKYRTILSKKLYYLSPDNSALHHKDLTGQAIGVYGNDSGGYYGQNDGFGRFAPFFRNYNQKSGDYRLKIQQYNAGRDVGQYVFGNASDDKWAKELAWVTTQLFADGATTNGATNGFVRTNSTTSTSYTTGHATGYYPMGSSSAGWNTGAQNYKKADGHGWDEVERAGVFNAKGEQEKGDVWFIDGGPYAFTADNNNMDWDTNATPTTLTDGDGITVNADYSVIDIAIGGIYDAQWTHYNEPLNNFFNVGKSDGNENYDGLATQDLVSKFYPGTAFRFREDPAGEVYTILPNVEEAQRLRWQTDNAFTLEVQPGYSGNQLGTNRTASHIQWAVQLSPNFSKNWKPKFINSTGGPTVNWDPTGDPGPIVGGLKLSILHSAVNVVVAAPNVNVTVDTLAAEDVNTGLVHNITTGMILTSHSDDGTTYDGTAGKEHLVIKEITDTGGDFVLHLAGYSKILTDSTNSGLNLTEHDIYTTAPTVSEAMIFEQPKMNGYSQYSVNRINQQDANGDGWSAIDPGIMAIGYNLEFLESFQEDQEFPSNPAIWETEPKESKDLDIYHEASGLNPLRLTEETVTTVIPYNSTVEHVGAGGVNYVEAGSFTNSALYDGTDWTITLITPSGNGVLVGGSYIATGEFLKIKKSSGYIMVEILDWGTPDGNGRTKVFKINSALYSDKTKYILDWNNCYSFGNGVESNRIRDNFNLPYVSNGAKVSTTLNEGLEEEHRKYGLIYSGIYNSNSSTNNLNQFIAAEKITKDVNPIYGSIQKLHSRDADLVVLCEDKCLRILANKDAVFNADGNPQLTATSNVLGQTIPFSGEFGISKDPESFASESYRVYFTDKVRGAVMRLSKDGLTPISMHGMKDWFKDNLKLSNKLIGSYDDRKEEYNLTLNGETAGNNLISNGYFSQNPSSMWFQSGTGAHWTWDDGNKNMFSDASADNRIGQYLQSPITLGKKYEISWDVGEPVNAALEGRLWVTLHDDSGNYTSIGGEAIPTTTPGTYTKTIIVGAPGSYNDTIPVVTAIPAVPATYTTTTIPAVPAVPATTTTTTIPAVPAVPATTTLTSPAVPAVPATTITVPAVPATYTTTTVPAVPAAPAGLGPELVVDGVGGAGNYIGNFPAGSGNIPFGPNNAGWIGNFGTNPIVSDWVISGGVATTPVNSYDVLRLFLHTPNPNYIALGMGLTQDDSEYTVTFDQVQTSSSTASNSYNQVTLGDAPYQSLAGSGSFSGVFTDLWVGPGTGDPSGQYLNNPYIRFFNQGYQTNDAWQGYITNVSVKKHTEATLYIPATTTTVLLTPYIPATTTTTPGTPAIPAVYTTIPGTPAIPATTSTVTIPGTPYQPAITTSVLLTAAIPASTSTSYVTTTVQIGNWQPWTWGGSLLSSINFHNKEITSGDTEYFNGTIDNVTIKEVTGISNSVSFKEEVRGWVSFKSFAPENAISMASDYYTMLEGKLYKHHVEGISRNYFYGNSYNSSINVILNDAPGIVKSFNTLNYEGSQSKIDQNSQDNNYNNLYSKTGWHVSDITTDKQKGSINEFIEKEGKWFNYIKGVYSGIDSITDFGAFDIQGIGVSLDAQPGLITFNEADFGGTISMNTSLQVGDIIYFQTPTLNGTFNTIDAGSILECGPVVALIANSIMYDMGATNMPSDGDYILFAKNHVVNTSSLLGYYADVKFENNSTGKAELFSVGSEINESSK